MKVLVPDYLLQSVIRHYRPLAAACRPGDGDTRTQNARRVADKEIQKVEAIISKSKSERMDNGER